MKFAFSARLTMGNRALVRRSHRYKRWALCAFVALLLFARAGGAPKNSKSPPCRASLSSCPDSGCYEASSAEGWENILKHNRLEPQVATHLTILDFINLQKQTDARFGHTSNCPKSYRNPSKAVRRRCLSHFKLTTRSDVSEQDYVELTGYFALTQSKSGPPKANTGGESVNCRLTGTNNNDFHINVVEKPNQSEFAGIVVEMIPQERADAWNLLKLRRAQNNRLLVRVRGQLMLDNKHRVNGDEAHNIGGQPKRSSLWEIHPVTEFYVCGKKVCAKDSDWTPLENWNEAGK